MKTVELIYDKDCPNLVPARTALLQAFVQAGIPPNWVEWDRSDPDSPDYVRSYGSPTILVDGKDIAGLGAADNFSNCRIYGQPTGRLAGVPGVESIARALKQSVPGKRSAIRNVLTTVPAIGVAFLPKLACPVCWPVYTALLSSMGIGFVNYTPYLMPLTVGFVLVAVAALLYRAKARKEYGPFILSSFAAMTLLLGKFAFNSDPVLFVGVGFLVIASLWDAWPRKNREAGSCPACVSTPYQEESK